MGRSEPVRPPRFPGPLTARMSRALLVLDCNVYLDVARLLGTSYSSSGFDALAVEHSGKPVPHPGDKAIDSLRLIAACQSGKLGVKGALEVWTSTHIRSTVEYKARQSVVPDPRTGHRGLGWDDLAAQNLVEDLVDWIAERSGGGHITEVIGAVDNPPLDHEDGTVYGACRYLEGQNPLDQVYCVTWDKGFLKDYGNGKLTGTVNVVTPAAMLQRIHAVRRGVMPRPRRSGSC